MSDDTDKIDHLDRHLQLCRRMYERMISEGKLDEVLAELASRQLKKHTKFDSPTGFT